MRRTVQSVGIALAIGAGAGCSGGDADTGAPETECGGAGTAAVQAGTGGLSGFTPWQDGDAVQILNNGTDAAPIFGFQAELLSTGLDTEAPVNTFLRFRTGDGSESQDAGASLIFQCPEEGPGWTGVFAPLADAYQDPTAAAELEGVALELTVLATDQDDETAELTLSLVYAAP